MSHNSLLRGIIAAWDQTRRSGGRTAIPLACKVFGLVLRQMRLARDISQDELAHRSGYHRTYVGMLERGERSPSIDTIFDLAETLGVKPSEMVAEVERGYRKTRP